MRVYPIPGHDAGQLALAPESLRWFIVGDLIQSLGTVVISTPEGDMATYFQTLEKIIELGPSVIVPSHGTPMRSTFRLQATLQHRREREKAVLELHADGKQKPRCSTSSIKGFSKSCFPSQWRTLNLTWSNYAWKVKFNGPTPQTKVVNI